MATPVHSISNTFAVMTPDQSVRPVNVTPDLYEKLDTDFAGFAGHALVSEHTFETDWPTWERHPAGDEIVVLLSGRATMVFRGASGDEAVTLAAAGSYVIVPRGTWHTARVPERARMLFVTPGEGTENRVDPGRGGA